MVICIPGLFVFCPETKGKSLEEVGLIFGDRHLHADLEGNIDKLEIGSTIKHDENQRSRDPGPEPEYIDR